MILSEPTTLDVTEPVTSVVIALGGGSVDVLAWAGPCVRVQVHGVSGQPLTMTNVDGVLRLEHHKDDQGQVWDTLKRALTSGLFMSTRLTVSVPAGTAVKVNSISAAVLVGGISGAVSVTTVTGAASLVELTGYVDAKTGSGSIEGQRVGGQLRAKTVTGGMSFLESTMRMARITTVSGSVRIGLASPNCLITVRNGSGDVSIEAPSGTGYDVTATSSSGHVVIDGQTLVDPERSGSGAGGHRAEGDRTLAVKASLISGNFVLQRDHGPQDVLPHEV